MGLYITHGMSVRETDTIMITNSTAINRETSITNMISTQTIPIIMESHISTNTTEIDIILIHQQITLAII